MDPSSRISRSWWFHLFGDKVLVVVVIVALAPAVYALVLLQRSQLLFGSALAVAWLVAYWLLLVVLHNRRIVRLPISIVCTVAVLAAVTLVLAGI